MSAHSHVTRIQMIEKSKMGGHQSRYAPIASSQGTPSIIYSELSDTNAPESVLSTGSRRPNPKDLKDFDMRRSKSQDYLKAPDESSFRGSSKNLNHSYAPSLRSLKPTSNMGQRIASKASLVSMSRSLGASKASLASQKSTIQQEYHDIKVQKKLTSPWFGTARKPFTLAVVFFVLALVFLTIGLAILFLRGFGNIFLSLDVGEIIGPLFVAMAIIWLALGIKFVIDAYNVSEKERRMIKFRGDNYNMIDVTKGSVAKKPQEKLITGTNTKEAISRKLMTSRTDLRDF